MRSPNFVQNLKLLLMSYYNMAQAQVKIGKSKNAELIFQHGLLLSEKFFITNTAIAKKYKKKVKGKRKGDKKGNFIEKNIQNASSPVIRHPGRKKLHSPRFMKSSKDNFMDIKTTEMNGTPRTGINVRINKPKKNKRVKSAFGNPYKEVPQNPEKEFIKSSDGEDVESKATKATKGISSEISNKISNKVVSFSEEDMDKIMETIKKNKNSKTTKMHNWQAFAEEQLQTLKKHKHKNKKCYA